MISGIGCISVVAFTECGGSVRRRRPCRPQLATAYRRKNDHERVREIRVNEMQDKRCHCLTEGSTQPRSAHVSGGAVSERLDKEKEK